VGALPAIQVALELPLPTGNAWPTKGA